MSLQWTTLLTIAKGNSCYENCFPVCPDISKNERNALQSLFRGSVVSNYTNKLISMMNIRWRIAMDAASWFANVSSLMIRHNICFPRPGVGNLRVWMRMRILSPVMWLSGFDHTCRPNLNLHFVIITIELIKILPACVPTKSHEKWNGVNVLCLLTNTTWWNMKQNGSFAEKVCQPLSQMLSELIACRFW